MLPDPAPEQQPTLATRLREEAATARAQDPGKPAQVPPGPQVWMSPELAEALAGVLEFVEDLRAALKAAEALMR